MIETHVFNAWLDSGLRETRWFSYLNFVNGFVAPSFLFISGVSFIFVVKYKWEKWISFNPDLFRQFRRLMVIWAIGYFLHMPRIEWNGWIPRFIGEDVAGFYQVDILQTISVSLIVLQIILFLTKNLKLFSRVTGLLTVSVLLVTTKLWQIDFFKYLHPFFGNYLNGMHNPLFPLFPWCVFLWSGTLVGLYFTKEVEETGEKRKIFNLTMFGIILFCFGYLCEISPIQLFTYENFWRTSPNWVILRLATLLILFGLLWFLVGKNWHTSSRIIFIGTQSLFAYVIHLMIIYSITGEKASLNLLSQNQSAGLTFVLYLILVMIVYFLTFLWQRKTIAFTYLRMRLKG